MVHKFFQSFSPIRIRWIRHWIFIGILIGVVSGFGAIVFNFLLRKGTLFFMKDLTARALPTELHHVSFLGAALSRWMVLWIPAFGGLLSSLTSIDKYLR